MILNNCFLVFNIYNSGIVKNEINSQWTSKCLIISTYTSDTMTSYEESYFNMRLVKFLCILKKQLITSFIWVI